MASGPAPHEANLTGYHPLTARRAEHVHVLLRTDELLLDTSLLDPHAQHVHGQAFHVADKELKDGPARYDGTTLEPEA